MLSRIREKINPLIDTTARPFARMGLTPNGLTILGLLVGILAALLFIFEEPLWAGLAVLVCGFSDMIDGAVARLTGKVTPFGGVLDSVLDRYVDFIIFIGIIYAGLAEFAGLSSWFWGVLALVGSLMVSYMRARAEAAGSGKLAVGIAERGERLLILAIGALLNYTNYAVVLIVFLTHSTVLHRLVAVWKRLR
ncbi:MAG: archaetidylinositol phosphate synthase [Candidatus Hadarchaeota archaeon]|nr:archaetidylinositol phosphate synthase [Candidatus Hadarchaeota archaeon]